MITINKGQANTVVLTLTEKVTLTTPYFLFCFENDQSFETKYFNATNASCDTSRFDKFTITEDSTEDLDNGTVSLTNPGQWSYTVYEVSTATEKDPDNAVTTLETGLVKVIDTETIETQYDISETHTVYEPD